MQRIRDVIISSVMWLILAPLLAGVAYAIWPFVAGLAIGFAVVISDKEAESKDMNGVNISTWFVAALAFIIGLIVTAVWLSQVGSSFTVMYEFLNNLLFPPQ